MLQIPMLLKNKYIQCCMSLLFVSSPSFAAQPTTFSPVIGAALLCHDQLDNTYFYSWLKGFFGEPYKHEGGAYWFHTPDSQLWNTQITDVMVSDDSSNIVFLGAITESSPEELEKAVHIASGIHYKPVDGSQYPVRKSLPGSVIAYYKDKSKIYCSGYKQQFTRP
jgi:hypothetical protein